MPFKDKTVDRLRHRIYAQTQREKYPERIKQSQKKYRMSDHGRAKAAVSASKHDAKERGHVGILSPLEDVIAAIRTHKCAFCGKEEPKEGRKFHIDHCHITGKLRGLLCGKHNKMLTDIQEMKNLIVWAESCV